MFPVALTMPSGLKSVASTVISGAEDVQVHNDHRCVVVVDIPLCSARNHMTVAEENAPARLLTMYQVIHTFSL